MLKSKIPNFPKYEVCENQFKDYIENNISTPFFFQFFSVGRYANGRPRVVCGSATRAKNRYMAEVFYLFDQILMLFSHENQKEIFLLIFLSWVCDV